MLDLGYYYSSLYRLIPFYNAKIEQLCKWKGVKQEELHVKFLVQ